jgi:hypothetical protein
VIVLTEQAISDIRSSLNSIAIAGRLIAVQPKPGYFTVIEQEVERCDLILKQAETNSRMRELDDNQPLEE